MARQPFLMAKQYDPFVRDHVLRYKIQETTEVTEIIRHKIDMTKVESKVKGKIRLLLTNFDLTTDPREIPVSYPESGGVGGAPRVYRNMQDHWP
ncbi:hypothetical protein IMZ48_10340 [Candidatus Bathyarchaeota archaeon]|nr:hypothetical protein [Candidatus Bathyarchaeota archaeon]